MLKKPKQQKTVHVISNTGWSAKANVVLAAKQDYNEIQHSWISMQQKMRILLPQAKQNIECRCEMR
jgi:hypothetical protein